MRSFPLLLLATLVAGCTSPSGAPRPSYGGAPAEFTPIAAVLAAAERPEGVTGVFAMEVRGAGRQDGFLYLSSEADYRDQRCLTIAIPPPLAAELETEIRDDPVVALKGKTLRVNGTAQRTVIWFFVNGKRTDKYYYQTHVRVYDRSQIRILH